MTPDGVNYVAGDNGIGTQGYPIGAADVVVDGVQSQTGAGKELNMLVQLDPVTNISQHVVEALLPQGTYFVRVCFVDSANGSLSAGAIPTATALNAATVAAGSTTPCQVGYNLSVAFGQLSGSGGVTN